MSFFKSQTTAWTEDRVATLTKLWKEGYSASQIAKQLGGVTRCTVIGKVYRLNLSGRGAPSKPQPRRSNVSRAIAAPGPKVAPPRPKAPPRPPKAEKPDLKLVASNPAPAAPAPAVIDLPPVAHDDTPGAVLSLKSRDCKWPIGDPQQAGFRFCCRPQFGELPYCEAHAYGEGGAYQAKHKHEKPNDYYRSLRRFCA